MRRLGKTPDKRLGAAFRGRSGGARAQQQSELPKIERWVEAGYRGAMPTSPTHRLRAICLALPEAAEQEAWGDPTFRVRDKIFAMEKSGDGRVSVWLTAPEGAQAMLIGADPERFFVPPYVGHKGWVGVRLDSQPDWDEVAALIRRSYRLIAPKRLAGRVG
jgi:hypothetical protein